MSWLHARRWEPVTAPFTNGSDHRSAMALDMVLAQFDLNHERYVPQNGETFCSTLAWDVSRAMACELPHFWLSGDKVIEQDANVMFNWLSTHGSEHGYEPVSAEGAILSVNSGMFVVAIWKALPGHHGHIVVGRPTPSTSHELLCKQAGAVNRDSLLLSSAFPGLKPLLWRHP